MFDGVQTLAHLFFNLAGIVSDTGSQLCSQNLLEHGRTGTDADAGAQGAEEIRAGDGNCRVLGGRIGEKSDENGSNALEISLC